MSVNANEYWECHITMTCTGKERAFVEQFGNGWTYSNITDDPILGPGAKCYATRHFHEKISLGFVVMATIDVARVLEQSGAKVIRRKVERVVFDSHEATV